MSTRVGAVSFLALCVGLFLYFDLTPAVTPFVVAPVGSDALENLIVPDTRT